MPVQNVLFLCNHNSARSIIAEALLNDLGGEKFRAYSCGREPGSGPHPMALETLRRHGHPVAGLTSKSPDHFATAGAPQFDYVITLCDAVVQEDCPQWPGQPTLAHWRLPNPAAVTESEEAQRKAFEDLYASLLVGLQIFIEDDERSLQRMALVA